MYSPVNCRTYPDYCQSCGRAMSDNGSIWCPRCAKALSTDAYAGRFDPVARKDVLGRTPGREVVRTWLWVFCAFAAVLALIVAWGVAHDLPLPGWIEAILPR